MALYFYLTYKLKQLIPNQLFMKQTLIIIILVFFVSCVGHNENMSYSNHIQQIDSIVSAGINKDSLEIILAGYKAGRDDVERMVLMRELGRA